MLSGLHLQVKSFVLRGQIITFTEVVTVFYRVVLAAPLTADVKGVRMHLVERTVSLLFSSNFKPIMFILLI